jgi:hypothetical protein
MENTCFLVDGELFHPGDSFTVPEDPVFGITVSPGSRRTHVSSRRSWR